jgi:glycosyltransferase involved in cell wall biosynthesis
MKILIVTQYFWPENFKINDIALGLKNKGHIVEVLTCKPNYPSGKFINGYTFFNKKTEFWNSIKINRSNVIPRRSGKGLSLFLNYVSFSIFGSIRVLFIRSEFEKIIVFEPSPITVGIPAIIAKFKFKAPIYFWVQDLWPASLSAGGGIKNKYIIKVFDWLTRLIYKHSEKILVQSKAFIPYILNQKVEIEKILYYPNTTENFYKYLSPDKELMSLLPNGFKIMFAGNIGEAQSFDTILKAAKMLKDENVDVNWLILGDGRMKNYVKNKIIEFGLEKNFLLLGTFPSDKMPEFFSCADLLLVSLKKDFIFSLTIPSKIQSYMACRKPILASLDGEGSKIIDEAKSGFTSNSEDYVGLKESVKKALSLSPDELYQLGINARNYYEKEFERDTLIDKLELIIS